eukprot:1593336-Rhodomonas_salina.3
MGREGRQQGAAYGALLLFAAILYANVTSTAGWVGPLALPGRLSQARGGGGFRIPCALRKRDPVALVPHLRPGMHARGVSTRSSVFEDGVRSGDDGDEEKVYDFLQGQEEEERPPLEYEGKVCTRADMEFGIQIENIGLEVPPSLLSMKTICIMPAHRLMSYQPPGSYAQISTCSHFQR